MHTYVHIYKHKYAVCVLIFACGEGSNTASVVTSCLGHSTDTASAKCTMVPRYPMVSNGAWAMYWAAGWTQAFTHSPPLR